jgi:hypothetical protein
MMRATQQATQPKPSAVLQVNRSPVLPPVTPVSPNASTRAAPPFINSPAAPNLPLAKPAMLKNSTRAEPPPPSQSITPAAGQGNLYGF